MAFQFSTASRNGGLDAIETAAGASAIMRLRSGAIPANCAAADTGTVIATVNLPADWMAAASNGSKVASGSWQDSSADAAGTLGHFRVYDSAGTVCHIQGNITATGGGGDMTADNINVSAGQAIAVSGFTISAGGA